MAMMWYGTLITEDMTKAELIAIIEQLGEMYEQSNQMAGRYLRAADPAKLLEKSE